MATLPTLIAFSVGENGILNLTVKGKAKVPDNVEVEAGPRGQQIIHLDQSDEDTVFTVAEAISINGDVKHSDDDAEYFTWLKDNFIPTANGGGYSAEGAGESEATDDQTFTPTEEEEEVATKTTKKGKSAKGAKSKQAKAEAKAAAKGKAVAAPKATKAAAPKAPKAPKEKKPERTEYDTKAIDAAFVGFAKQHGIRMTHVIAKQTLQRLQEEDGKIVVGEAPAAVRTIGVIPGKTYEITKQHKEWGPCDYKVQILKDGTLKLVAFKGTVGPRKGLKTGATFPNSKAFLKEALQLDDPHVSFYKFFGLDR